MYIHDSIDVKLEEPQDHRIVIVTAENSTLTMTLTGEWRRRRSELHRREPNKNFVFTSAGDY